MKKNITFEKLNINDWFIYHNMVYIKAKNNYAFSIYLTSNPKDAFIWIDKTVEVIPINKNMAVKSMIKEWTAAYDRYLKDSSEDMG